jgi:hypothetical protein
MAIGIVDNESFDAELARLTNPTKPPSVIHIEKSPPGRSEGDNNVPNELRKVIQDENLNGTSPTELSKTFGISPSSISAYKKGATSTASYNNPNQELVKSGNDVRLRISSKATSKILLAMKHITEDKLANGKARDLAGIAKDMSAVVKNIMPESSSGNGQNNFIFYAPRNKQEDSYDIIHLAK